MDSIWNKKGEKMAVKKVDIEKKWDFNLEPLIKIEHYIIKAFIVQLVYAVDILSSILWFELHLSSYRSCIKLGVYKIYFEIGGGIDE